MRVRHTVMQACSPDARVRHTVMQACSPDSADSSSLSYCANLRSFTRPLELLRSPSGVLELAHSSSFARPLELLRSPTRVIMLVHSRSWARPVEFLRSSSRVIELVHSSSCARPIVFLYSPTRVLALAHSSSAARNVRYQNSSNFDFSANVSSVAHANNFNLIVEGLSFYRSHCFTENSRCQACRKNLDGISNIITHLFI